MSQAPPVWVSPRVHPTIDSEPDDASELEAELDGFRRAPDDEGKTSIDGMNLLPAQVVFPPKCIMVESNQPPREDPVSIDSRTRDSKVSRASTVSGHDSDGSAASAVGELAGPVGYFRGSSTRASNSRGNGASAAGSVTSSHTYRPPPSSSRQSHTSVRFSAEEIKSAANNSVSSGSGYYTRHQRSLTTSMTSMHSGASHRNSSVHSKRFSLLHGNPFKIDGDNQLALRIFKSKQAMAAEVLRQNTANTSRFIIHPYSPFKWHWDLLVVFLIIYTVCMMPVMVAFFSHGISEGWFIVNCIVDIIYIVDVVLNFRTGIVKFSAEGPQVIMESREIAFAYLKSSFAVDFFSSIPFDHIVTLCQGGNIQDANVLSATSTIKFLRFTRLLSLLRLLKVTRLIRCARQVQECLNIGPGAVRMLNLSLMVLLIAHWNGCIQFLTARLEGFPVGSWVERIGLENADPSVQYAWSLFKALSHMLCIGYGQFPPITLTECWLTIWSVLMGATFYAMFIGHMTTVMASIDTASRSYSLKVSAINEFMAAKRVPRATRQRVHEYFDECCSKQKWFEEDKILCGLSRNLQIEIMQHCRGQIVGMVPFLKNAGEAFISAVVLLLEPMACIPGERIIRVGETETEMYLIQYGTIDVFLKGAEVEAAVSLSEGDHFGEIAFLENRPRNADVVATTACRVFRLTREKFMPLLKSHPSVLSALQRTARQRLRKAK